MKTLNSVEIVYPPSAELSALAKLLERDLRAYRIPPAVRKRIGIASPIEVKEPWLIVLCTPETPKDPGVNEAIERFTAEGRYPHILTLLVSGAPKDCFPESLKYEKKPDGTVIEHEPLAANISDRSLVQQRRKLRTEKLRILAPILGVTYDDLLDRRRRRRNRILTAGGMAILAGAATFLIYAVGRMQVMAGQNEALREQYAVTDAARIEAQEQRDAAEEAFARSVGLEAGTALDRGDAELALMLCLEYLPAFRQVDELTGTISAALNAMCKAGYVPVTTRAAYILSNDTALDLAPVTEAEEHAAPGNRITAAVPDDREYRTEKVSLDLMDWSARWGYALYSNTARTAEGEDIWLLWREPLDPKEDGDYLQDREGEILSVEYARILPDGSFYGVSEGIGRRYDPDTGECLPVFDGDDVLEYTLPCSIVRFLDYDGFSDFIFAAGNSHGLEVYDREPFAPRYVINDEHTARIDTSKFEAVAFADGSRYLVLGEIYVYDAENGTFLYEIDDHGQKLGDEMFSSDGLMTLNYADTLYLWNMAQGTVFDSIPGVKDYTLFGPYEKSTGRRDASLLAVIRNNNSLSFGNEETLSNNGGYVWEYHRDARSVPEDLDGQIALAKELLHGRTLTETERLAAGLPVGEH